MELLQMLINQLGITEEQAKGGTGLLFKVAKDKLSSDEFKQVANAIPGIEGLISSAPKAGGIMGAIGGFASSLGGDNKIGNLASLAGGFKNLNLSTDMIGKFLPIVMSFLQSKGGDTVKRIIEKALT